jgi:hypothetical protein
MQRAGLVNSNRIPPEMQFIQGIPEERPRRTSVEAWARGPSHEGGANSPAEGSVCKKTARARRQPGETIATYDVARALRGESGRFEVISPTGEVHHVTCEPDRSLPPLEWARNGACTQPFLICKIAEPAALEHERKSALAGSAHPRQVPPSFLGRHEREEPKPQLPSTEPARPDLFGLEGAQQDKQPSAGIVWKTGTAAHAGPAFVTASCAKHEPAPEITKGGMKMVLPVVVGGPLLAGSCAELAPATNAVSTTAAANKSGGKAEAARETAMGASKVSGISQTSRTDGKRQSLMCLLSEQWSRICGQISVRRVKKRLRVCETVSLGEKRFVAVVQVDGEEFLVGGASNSVCTLARLQRPQEFVDVLKRTWAEDPAQA